MALAFPTIHFFVPEIVLILKENELQIGVDTSVMHRKFMKK